MKNNGKVTAIGYDGELSNAHGTFYKWSLQFDNGDAGTYLSKTNPQTKFTLGENAHYDFNKEKGRIFYVNPDYENNKQSGGRKFDPQRELRIVRQSSLANAIAYHAAKDEENATIDRVIKTAVKFVGFVMGDNDAKQPQSNTQQSDQVPPMPSIVDDAPF